MNCSTRDSVKSLSLELTEACNYKCKMCDYWKIKNPKFLSISHVEAILDYLKDEPLNNITVTGGEPLLHPNWRGIAGLLPERSRKFLCTNGSPIINKNDDVGGFFDIITVSVDGATDEKFAEIRGYSHLTKILHAIERIKSAYPASKFELKMTVQKANFAQTNDFMRLARDAGFIDAVCFGVPDISQLAFGFDSVAGNHSEYLDNTMLSVDECLEFERFVNNFYEEFSEEVESGFHLEGDLRRILARFKSFAGIGDAPASRNCRIANHNIVLKSDGMLKGCYFLGNFQTIDELLSSGEFRARADFLAAHSPLQNKICVSCDQIDVLKAPPAFAIT